MLRLSTSREAHHMPATGMEPLTFAKCATAAMGCLWGTVASTASTSAKLPKSHCATLMLTPCCLNRCTTPRSPLPSTASPPGLLLSNKTRRAPADARADTKAKPTPAVPPVMTAVPLALKGSGGAPLDFKPESNVWCAAAAVLSPVWRKPA